MRKPKTPEQKARDRIRSNLRYQENKDNPEFREKIKLNTQNWQLRFPEKYMLSQAKCRAKARKIVFNISLEDFKIPQVCPILGIPLIFGMGYAAGNSPTLDRIVPALGYIKGNVQVISLKANLMKSNATPEELHKFAEWIFISHKISS